MTALQASGSGSTATLQHGHFNVRMSTIELFSLIAGEVSGTNSLRIDRYLQLSAFGLINSYAKSGFTLDLQSTTGHGIVTQLRRNLNN